MENNDNDHINDPGAFYGKRIIIDFSLSDQENDQYTYWLSLSAEQRLALATKLTEALYRNTPRTSEERRIYFDT